MLVADRRRTRVLSYDSSKATEQVTFRLTKKEFALLKELAQGSTVSDYLRGLVAREASHRSDSEGLHPKAAHRTGG